MRCGETDKKFEREFKDYFTQLDWQSQDEILIKLQKIRGN